MEILKKEAKIIIRSMVKKELKYKVYIDKEKLIITNTYGLLKFDDEESFSRCIDELIKRARVEILDYKINFIDIISNTEFEENSFKMRTGGYTKIGDDFINITYDERQNVIVTGKGALLDFDKLQNLKIRKIESSKVDPKISVHKITFKSFEYYLMPLAQRE